MSDNIKHDVKTLYTLDYRDTATKQTLQHEHDKSTLGSRRDTSFEPSGTIDISMSDEKHKSALSSLKQRRASMMSPQPQRTLDNSTLSRELTILP